jgi:curved DNA-binding protein CbpA
VRYDPFAELGLPALAELTDEDVHAAWRRIAAATHPDREDGGDAARFGAAAAAYVVLKTSFGRGEALADLGGSAASGRPRRRHRARAARRGWHPRRLWQAPRSPDQRRGAHRLRAAASPAWSPAAPPAWSPARSRHARDAAIRVTLGTGTRNAGDARSARAGHARRGQAGYARSRLAGYARSRLASYTRGRLAGYARSRLAGYARGRPAGYVTVDWGLARAAGAAALGAAAAIAVVGWTPATIGLVAGALTVTAWGLWRRAWRDR